MYGPPAVLCADTTGTYAVGLQGRVVRGAGFGSCKVCSGRTQTRTKEKRRTRKWRKRWMRLEGVRYVHFCWVQIRRTPCASFSSAASHPRSCRVRASPCFSDRGASETPKKGQPRALYCCCERCSWQSSTSTRTTGKRVLKGDERMNVELQQTRSTTQSTHLARHLSHGTTWCTVG